MKKKILLSMALGMCVMPKLIARPHEAYAFSMGGSANTACDIMIAVNHEANYDITLKTKYGTETVPFMAKFNPNCAKVTKMDHAVKHINNGTNLFFLQQYGDMVAYIPVAPGYAELHENVTSLSVLPNNTSNKHGSLFVGYSVPRNDTSCGATHGKYKPICDNSNHYGWGHALKSYTTSDLKALASAIKKEDQSKINSLTGESFFFLPSNSENCILNVFPFQNK